MTVVFRFYLEGRTAQEDATLISERKYTTIIPPIPRKGDKVVLDKDLFVVVDTPTHYFEKVHEVGIVLFSANMIVAPVPVPDTETGTNQSFVPRNEKGWCAYCNDPECDGGIECNFYDGSLG